MVRSGVAGVEVEFGRGGRDERFGLVGVEADAAVRAVDGRAGRCEGIERPVAEDLDADLGQDPERGAVDGLDLVGGQDLERPERVGQAAPGELAKARSALVAADGGDPDRTPGPAAIRVRSGCSRTDATAPAA